MIPQRDLSLLSNRLARGGGRRIPEAVLEKDYCLSWFLVGMSATPLKDILAFKGGTAIKKCYIPDYRFSEDLDFTLRKETALETIRGHLDEASGRTEEASGIKIRFSRYDRHSHENSHTFYLAYEGPLPGAAGKEVKVDITIRERIVFPVETLPVLKAYAEYRDIPADALIGVYSLNEIAIENEIMALTDILSEDQIAHLIDIWYNGLIHQVTNLPPDIMIEKWIYDQFPALRPLQLKSLKKQHSESMAGLTETVHRMTPHTILFATNVMNYAFFRILGLHVGRNFVREYSSSRYIGKGKELASITERNYTDSHEGDNVMIDKWAAFVNISDWFKWRGFEDIPPNYLQPG